MNPSGEEAPAPSPATTPQPVHDVERRAARAFLWAIINVALGRLGSLVVGVVLARILGPAGIGIFGVAMIALMASLSLNDLGVTLAIVRWPRDPAPIVPTIATLSLAFSVIVAVLMVSTADLVAHGLGAPSAAPVIRALAAAVILDGLAACPAALMQRQFQQRRRTAIDQVNSWVGAAVSVLLAINGWGAMSLALGRISGATVGAIAFILSFPTALRFGFDRAILGELLRFGLPLAGSSLIVFGAGYLDQIIVATMLGKIGLGYYVLASNVSNWPVSALSQPLRSVGTAAFSAIQHDGVRLTRAFQRTMSVIQATLVPACVLLSAAAPTLIDTVYGAEWGDAATALKWLALGAIARVLFEVAYDFLVVTRRSARVFSIQAVWIVATVPAVLLGSRHGIEGVAAAQAAVLVLVVGPLYGSALKSAGVDLRAIVGPLGRPIVAGAVLWMAIWAVRTTVSGPAAVLVLASCITALVWVVLMRPHRAMITSLLPGGRGDAGERPT